MRRQAALAKARRKLEVDRHAVVREMRAAGQALRAAGARTRQAATVLEQLARHTDLGAVDRKQPPPAPAFEPLVAETASDSAWLARFSARTRGRTGSLELQTARSSRRLPPPAVPADPLVAAPKPVRGTLEQQAPRPAISLLVGLRRLERHLAQFGQAALKQLQARMHAVIAGTGALVQMLAHHPSQLLAAQRWKQLRRAPGLDQLPARRPQNVPGFSFAMLSYIFGSPRLYPPAQCA